MALPSLCTPNLNLKALFYAAPVGMIVIDTDRRVVMWNGAAQRIFGWSEEEIVGRPYPIVPPEKEGEFRAHFEAACRGEHVLGIESRRRRRDGSGVDVRISSAPLQDEGETISGIIAILEDISEHKRAEENLQSAYQSLRTLVQASPVPTLALDLKGRVIEWNPAAERTFGWFREEILGRPYPLVPDTEQEEFRRHWDEVRGGTVLLAREVRRRHRSGTFIDVSLSLAPLTASKDRIVGFIAILEDITERKRAEAALRESERKYRELSGEYRALLDGIPDPLFLVSPELTLVWANRRAEEEFGLQGPLTGEPCLRLWQERSVPCDECMLADCFSWGRTEEIKLETPDGLVWGAKAFPIREEKGRVSGVILWATDITEKVRLREEASRSARLASLGELAAGVAHEINNPNGLVSMNLPLLRDVFADAAPLFEAHCREAGDFTLGRLKYSRLRRELPLILEEMLEASGHIRSIVEDLKNFSRQSPADHFVSFDLNRAVERAVRLCGNALRQATDRFEVLTADGLPTALGHPQRIEQVMVNLILNACHALPDRSRGIRLCTEVSRDGRSLLCILRDEGTGIAPEHLPHVTDPFFTTRRESGGTGLGLSVSARIIREHGGTLDFASTPGKGTIVTLSLPVEENAP